MSDQVNGNREDVRRKNEKRCAEQKPQDAFLEDELVEMLRCDLPDEIVPVGDLNLRPAVTLPWRMPGSGPGEFEKWIIKFPGMWIVRLFRTDAADSLFEDFMRHVEKNKRKKKKRGNEQDEDHVGRRFALVDAVEKEN